MKATTVLRTKNVTSPASTYPSKVDSNDNNSEIQQPVFYKNKLIIRPAEDLLENEADSMADKVMRMEMPEPINLFSPGININRKCAQCEEEEKIKKKERK